MEVFRKYFTESQLKDLVDTGPNWGVNVHTVGHYVHPPGRVYPDPGHPSTHAFEWEKGRRLQELPPEPGLNQSFIFRGFLRKKRDLRRVPTGKRDDVTVTQRLR
jgi:hypothetical protein